MFGHWKKSRLWPNEFCLAANGHVLDTWPMRWRIGPVRKRHVPEPERLRQLAANLKGQADKLSQKADALIGEAEAFEAADRKKRKQAN